MAGLPPLPSRVNSPTSHALTPARASYGISGSAATSRFRADLDSRSGCRALSRPGVIRPANVLRTIMHDDVNATRHALISESKQKKQTGSHVFSPLPKLDMLLCNIEGQNKIAHCRP